MAIKRPRSHGDRGPPSPFPPSPRLLITLAFPRGTPVPRQDFGEFCLEPIGTNVISAFLSRKFCWQLPLAEKLPLFQSLGVWGEPESATYPLVELCGTLSGPVCSHQVVTGLSAGRVGSDPLCARMLLALWGAWFCPIGSQGPLSSWGHLPPALV